MDTAAGHIRVYVGTGRLNSEEVGYVLRVDENTAVVDGALVDKNKIRNIKTPYNNWKSSGIHEFFTILLNLI